MELCDSSLLDYITHYTADVKEKRQTCWQLTEHLKTIRNDHGITHNNLRCNKILQSKSKRSGDIKWELVGFDHAVQTEQINSQIACPPCTTSEQPLLMTNCEYTTNKAIAYRNRK